MSSLRLTPKNIEELRICLHGQPDDRKVEAEPDTGVFEKTVDELRARTIWPPDLVVTTPRESYTELTVKISKSSS